MSWDVYFQDFGNYKRIEDIPEDFQPQPIGNKLDIINKIKEIAPDLNDSDDSWLILENDKFSIEFNIGKTESLDSIMLHIRGNESVIGFISELIIKLQLRAVDMSTGKFIDISNHPKGLKLWTEYRDFIMKKK
jgi:hypothetical protein